MKKLLLFIFAFFLGVNGFAQSREFNYKALITNNGNALNNQAVNLKFTILENGNMSVYSETYSTTTDANGIVVEGVGDGTILSGDFSTIDWGSGRYFLKVEIDINDGNGFQDFGLSELKSVPYAKYADKAGNVFSGDFGDLTNIPAGLADGDDDTQLTDAQIASMGYIKDANDADHDATNELQTLTFDNATRTLSIINGNSVTIPAGGSTGGDGWGTQVVATNGSINGDGTSGSPLGINTNDAVFNGWDKNASDDFDGDFTHLTNIPAGLADGDDDTQLSEAQVDAYADNNGYAKSIDDLIDGKVSGTSIFLGLASGASNTGISNTAVGEMTLFDNTSGNHNTAIGTRAMLMNESGTYNTALGAYAMRKNVANSNSVAIGAFAMAYADDNPTGTYNTNNVAVGAYALKGSTTAGNNTGKKNTAIGAFSLESNTSGSYNVALGSRALYRNKTGAYNTVLGTDAGLYNQSGNKNVMLGFHAGYNATGNNNIFIGADAGKNETGNDKLYIENSDSTTPLIGGDFSTDEVVVNGTLQVTGGTPGAGKVFTSDANGKGSWQTIVDNDTQLTETQVDNFVSNNGYLTLATLPDQTDADFYVVGTTDTPASITDHIFHNGTMTLGTDNASVGEYAKLKIFNGMNEAVYIEATGGADSATGMYLKASGVYATGIENVIAGNGSGIKMGIINSLETTGTGNQLATYNILGGDTSGKQFATYDTIYNSGNADHYGRYSVLSGSGSGLHTGTYHKLTGDGAGSQVGVQNIIDNTNGEMHMGTYNRLDGNGNGNRIAVYNELNGNGNGRIAGVVSLLDGDGTGKQYGTFVEISGTGTGNKYGMYAKLNTVAGGAHYAIYGEATKVAADVYAGYFKGNVKATQNVEIEGKLTSPVSGNADMKAHIYGQINEGASGPQIASESSDGFSITEVSAGTYRVTFDTAISGSKYVIVTNLYNSTGFITYSNKSTTNFLVKTYNVSGGLEDKPFSFVVYKK